MGSMPDAPPLDCETLLVNLNGCGIRSATAIPVGSSVHVRAGKDEIPGRVVTCIQATGANAFSLGIKFDRPYFWPVPNPPADWVAHPISKSSQPQRSNPPAAPPRVAPPVATPAVPTRPAPPPPAASVSAPVASSANTVKDINDAVSRAVTITSKLD